MLVLLFGFFNLGLKAVLALNLLLELGGHRTLLRHPLCPLVDRGLLCLLGLRDLLFQFRTGFEQIADLLFHVRGLFTGFFKLRRQALKLGLTCNYPRRRISPRSRAMPSLTQPVPVLSNNRLAYGKLTTQCQRVIEIFRSFDCREPMQNPRRTAYFIRQRTCRVGRRLDLIVQDESASGQRTDTRQGTQRSARQNLCRQCLTQHLFDRTLPTRLNLKC